MPITKKWVKPPPPRKPGERAQLSPEKIVDAALVVLEEMGLGAFSARAVAMRLKVSSAAIYMHFDDGQELKTAMARQVLSGVARPYRPDDSPTSYLQSLALRLLTELRRKQATAQLVALELAADYLVCPEFTERLLSVLMTGSRRDLTASQRLDIGVATFVGMALVEAGAVRGSITDRFARRFKPRVVELGADLFPVLSGHSDGLMMQIKGRLVPADALLRDVAKRHMEPVISVLALD